MAAGQWTKWCYQSTASGVVLQGALGAVVTVLVSHVGGQHTHPPQQPILNTGRPDIPWRGLMNYQQLSW